MKKQVFTKNKVIKTRFIGRFQNFYNRVHCIKHIKSIITNRNTPINNDTAYTDDELKALFHAKRVKKAGVTSK